MSQNVVSLPAEYRGFPQLENAWRVHQDKLHQIEARFRPLFENIEQRLEEAQTDYDRIYGTLNRPPRYARLWYWPCMAILALAEVPVNRLSFELFFGESPILSLIVAALVGAVLLLMAHFLGLSLRRFGHNVSYVMNQNPGISTFVAMLPSLVAVLLYTTLIGLLCYGIGLLRQGYLAFTTRADPSFADLIDSNQYAEAAATLVLQTALNVEGMIFVVLNLAIVTVGVLFAFFCHDAHPDYEKVDRNLKKQQRAKERVNVQYGRSTAGEEGRFAAVRERLSAQAK